MTTILTIIFIFAFIFLFIDWMNQRRKLKKFLDRARKRREGSLLDSYQV